MIQAALLKARNATQSNVFRVLDAAQRIEVPEAAAPPSSSQFRVLSGRRGSVATTHPALIMQRWMRLCLSSRSLCLVTLYR